MKKVLFLAKYGHDLNYFRAIKNYVTSRKQNTMKIDLIFNLPLFFFELFYVLKKIPITPIEMAEMLKYEIARKFIKYGNFKGNLFAFFIVIIAKLYYFKYSRILKAGKYDVICVFGGYHVAQKMAICVANSMNIRVFHFENGFLPNTTVMDFKGTNYNNSVPRDFNFYKPIEKNFQRNPLNVRKNIIGLEQKEVILPEKYIFCPFQVALDTRILVHSPWVKNMEHFYAILTEVGQNLDVTFVLKQHPSCIKDYPNLRKIENPRIIFANYNSTESLIANSQAVITINSSVGMEAIMLGKKVITLGNAFFSGYGFARDSRSVMMLIKEIKNLDDWQVDVEMVEKFVSYLQNYYLIPGSWKAPDAKHLEAIYQRLN